MSHTQISNPRGAFGYTTSDDMRGGLTIRLYHNMSSVNPIQVGSAVVLSSASTDGKGVAVSTLIGDPRFVGIALTSASTGQSTHLSSLAPSSVWCQVCVQGGPVTAMLSTATVPGDFVFVSAATVAAGASNGGLLGPVVLSTAVGGVQKIAGYAHTSGSTLNEAGTTQTPRGLITLEKGYIVQSTLTTVFT